MANQMTLQEMAIKTFGTIVERAIAYRDNPSANDRELFNPRYGICDNVYICMPQEYKNTHHSKMMHVKDNLIRQVPSFSGAYHYPVPAPGVNRNDHVEMVNRAESAYDNSNDKWSGAYGEERLIQAQEVLEWVTNKWQDALAGDMTPAQRNGIIANVTVMVHKVSGEFFIMQRDDGTTDPYFMPFGETNTDLRRSIDLAALMIYNRPDVEYRSVVSLIKEFNRHKAKRVKLEAKIKALEEMVKAIKLDSFGVELALRAQHNVQIVNR